MEAKHFDFNLFKPDVDAFKKAKADNNIDNFLAEYVAKYKSQEASPEDILSMFLIAAVHLRNYEVVEHCLNSLTEWTSLTTTDKTNYSPITSMLLSGDQTNQILFDNYFTKESLLINKVEATKDDFDHIITMLEYPQLEGLDTDACMKNYIMPLYSEECIGNIKTELQLD